MEVKRYAFVLALNATASSTTSATGRAMSTHRASAISPRAGSFSLLQMLALSWLWKAANATCSLSTCSA
ncbi:hypothetical protein ABIE78_001644 [Sinorhizobium fredii]